CRSNDFAAEPICFFCTTGAPERKFLQEATKKTKILQRSALQKSLFVNFASFCCSYLSQPEKEFLQKVAKETKAGVGICNPSLTSLPSVHVFALFGGFYLCGLSSACARRRLSAASLNSGLRRSAATNSGMLSRVRPDARRAKPRLL